jgi:hypothetical protein
LSVAEAPHYRMTLQPLTSRYPPVVRIRRLLKLALRAFALKCVRVEELPAVASGAAPGERGGPAKVREPLDGPERASERPGAAGAHVSGKMTTAP